MFDTIVVFYVLVSFKYDVARPINTIMVVFLRLCSTRKWTSCTAPSAVKAISDHFQVWSSLGESSGALGVVKLKYQVCNMTSPQTTPSMIVHASTRTKCDTTRRCLLALRCDYSQLGTCKPLLSAPSREFKCPSFSGQEVIDEQFLLLNKLCCVFQQASCR